MNGHGGQHMNLAELQKEAHAIATPARMQRRRTKGWRMPENTVYVGRPTKWGNPYPAGRNVRTPNAAVASYIRHLRKHPNLVETARRELQGKNLASWCSLDLPCHADVLLEVANESI